MTATLMALALSFFTPVALANDNQSLFDLSKIRDKLDGSFALLLMGPSTQSIDGDLDGRGTNLSLRNYLSFDYQFAQNWEADVGGEFRQYFRPIDPNRPGRKEFEARDPYLGITRKDLAKGDIFSMVARVKYYLPISEYNLSKRGRPFDTGRGQIQGSLGPQWRKGDITVGLPLESSVNFAAEPTADREDFSVKIKPSLAYRISSKISSKIEYSTGDLRHNVKGKWSKFNDKDLGHKATVYASYFPMKDLLISPAISWGKNTWRLNRAELSLFASYTFL